MEPTQIKTLTLEKFSVIPSDESIKKTIEGLKSRNIEAEVISDGHMTLARIKELIPAEASVMNGSSRTLEQIGFVEYLKSEAQPWNNLHEAILNESDPAKKSQLRKQAALSDYYLGSVHALTESGEMVIASNTGSQLPHIVYTSKNLIFVVSARKITSDLAQAFQRIQAHVIPLEDENMKQKYGSGTSWNKTVIFHRENPNMGRTVRVILVKEALGF
jgi:L-lactate utilization protein LutC